ncbi:serine/threonine-protein kinase MPS1-like isoform X2 [Tripterygium wilfordii]|uniref:serine/threonine-protein kinase MPS1-like isoform X2 n=1 Tax=Tripterygium wilfordii TaxID=458696 RepID=UPI0018F8390D|nr:serine/threonine-protein kinase MPS1-like isoform X2 [Tripterygium wilfordii]
MDREANLPVPSVQPTASKNIVPQIANSDRTSSASSSLSSSSPPPDFLRHVQAAFKRHRPLGTMQSSSIGPRRMFVPQHEASSSAASNVGSKVDTEKSHDVISRSQSHALRNSVVQPKTEATVVGETLEDASITTPSISGTLTKTFEDGFNPFGVQTAQFKPIAGHKNDNVKLPSHVEPQHLDGEKKGEVSSGMHTSSQKMEWDAGNQAEVSTLINHVSSKHNFQNPELDISLRSEGGDRGVSASLSKGSIVIQDQLHEFRSFLSQPATQFSVAGPLCATTTNVHSTSAPILNSMTYSSQLHPDTGSHARGQSVGDCNSNSQRLSQRNMVSSHKDTFGTLINQTGIAAQVSSLATDNHVGVNECDSSKKQEDCVPKENEMPKNPSARVDDLGDAQPRASLSDVKLEPSKSEKQQRVPSGKGTTVPRKKNYDPDLFFKVNGKLYQRLGKIGSGGSSEVHKVISSDCTIYALKKIKLKGRDYATAYGFCQEIEYLNKLKGKNNIIQLVDYEVTDKTLLREVMSGSMNYKDCRVKDDGCIYMVLEYGEIDLAHMLSQKWKELDGSDQTIDDNWLRFYWQQILQAVNTIHEERIVHSDLKPANFLLVKGSLKLIDFGIAKAIMSDTTNIQRDSQVGTLSYMSPEAFMCNESDANGNTIKCGRPSDIWSLGCILYQMVYGRTPFSEYRTFWAKFKVITDPNHEITYEPVSNPWLLDLMKKCLAWDRNERWRIPQLLQHPFLVPPVPLQPSLSQYNGCKLLQFIAESCANNQEAAMLSSQLKQLLVDPVIPLPSQSFPSQQCEFLSQISSLCSQLHDCLAKIRGQN